MKKIFLAIFALLLTLAVSINTTYALTTKTFTEASSEWVKNGNYYYLNYNVMPFDSYNADSQSGTIILPQNYVIEFKNSIPFENHGTNNTWMQIPTSTVNGYTFNRASYNFNYESDWGGYYDTQLNGTATGMLNASNNHTYEFRYYIVATTPSETELNTVAELPETAGSLFTTSMVMGHVNVSVNNQKVLVTMSYNSELYYLEFTFSSSTDMSIFDNREAFYYTHENEKFIIFNHGDYSIFTSQNVKAETFVPYTIWNLSTNEIESFNRMNVYMYSKMESGNNAYAYFYVDEFIIDNLISVSLAFKYRYNYIIGNGEYQEKFLVLEENRTVKIDKDTWIGKLLKGSVIGTAISSISPGLSWPALFIGTALLRNTDSSIIYRQVQEIEKLSNPSQELKTELTTAYTKHDPKFKPITTTNPIFKLHLGQYNDFFSTGIEIDPAYTAANEQKGINILQFTYRTSGQLYTIKGENINIVFEAGPGTDGNGKSGFNINLSMAVSLGLALFVFIRSTLNHRGGLTSITLLEWLKLIILSGIIYFITFYAIEYILNNAITFLRL